VATWQKKPLSSDFHELRAVDVIQISALDQTYADLFVQEHVGSLLPIGIWRNANVAFLHGASAQRRKSPRMELQNLKQVSCSAFIFRSYFLSFA
jgi:hypothetical protein